MSRQDQTDLDSLVFGNRAASRVLNPRGTIRVIPTRGSGGESKPKKKALPILLWAMQALVIVGCLWSGDKFILDGQLCLALGDKLQIGSAHLRVTIQKLTYRVGLSVGLKPEISL